MNLIRGFLGLRWVLFIALAAGLVPCLRAATDDELFSGPVQHFVITLAPDQLALLASRRGMGSERTTAEGMVQVGSNVFTEVRVQTKGSGTFRPVAFRPSLTIKFRNSQPCFGLTKLHLNNSVHDPARLNEFLGGELHRQAGVPTPRATPVRVTLNGRDLGVYVLKEGFDGHFLARNFQDASGNLYDPTWGADIDSPLEVDSGPGRAGWKAALSNGGGAGATQMDREALLVATGSPLKGRLAALTAQLDVERFVSTMALQLMTDDWDGYVRHQNNYRLYHDPTIDRFVFLPHGMDHLFGSPRSRVFWPEITGIVAGSIMATPGMQDRIRLRIEELGKTVFAETNVIALLDRTEARLQAGLAGRSAREAGFYQQQAALLRERVRQRIAWVAAGSKAPVELPVGAGFALKNWEPWAEVPDTDLERRKQPDGTEVLSITAHSPATCAAWRSRILLAPGHYRFEGTVSIQGVRLFSQARDPGVGLRVVPARRGTGLQGTMENARVTHDFYVDAATEVVFVAELSAHAGSAAFLLDSLRVVRLDAPR